MPTPALRLILITSAAVYLHKQAELEDKIKSNLVFVLDLMLDLFVLQGGLQRGKASDFRHKHTFI